MRFRFRFPGRFCVANKLVQRGGKVVLRHCAWDGELAVYDEIRHAVDAHPRRSSLVTANFVGEPAGEEDLGGFAPVESRFSSRVEQNGVVCEFKVLREVGRV